MRAGVVYTVPVDQEGACQRTPLHWALASACSQGLRSLRTNIEAAPGPAKFTLRAPQARLHVRHGGLRIEANCSTGGP
eukprot:11210639-Alexandrium_andersonii.AAC.1